MPPTNQVWVELMRNEPERFTLKHNRDYFDSREIIMACECSQSTAYKLGLIAVKAYKLKAQSAKVEGNGVGAGANGC